MARQLVPIMMAVLLAAAPRAGRAGSCGFTVTGGLGTHDLTGAYRQTAVTCNGEPTYQRTTGTGAVLFSKDSNGGWMIGPEDRLADCAANGWMNSIGSNCDSPDSTDCPGGWRE